MGEVAYAVHTMTRKEIEARAVEVLRQHGLYSIPVDPVVLANREGIKVHNAKFWQDGVSGVVAKRSGLTSLLVNQSDAPARKRFTIAHELGHHFLHLLKDGAFIDKEVDLFRGEEAGEVAANKREEVEANQFAAALLMPADLLRQEFERTQELAVLARLFNVSEAAMGIRLSQLRLI